MRTELEHTLDNLYEIEGVKACILYRLDGVPITVRSPPDSTILEVMFWLENQIKYVLRNMNKEGLQATTFDFKNNQILLTPSSRSTVLVTIIDIQAHQQLISIEIARAKSIIHTCVS
ncbi:MAG: roadblock/LC7 domain-containing protein [ANME-2 cluster archaeon]|nr:roadblock/LC7 domain-containing protein [ANME-2 cluster archaeon]